MQQKRALGAIIAACILAIVFWQQTRFKTITPDSVFTTLRGEQIVLHDLRGQPVLVTFWATDCRACIEEIPDLIALHEQFANNGLRIIAVTMPYDIPSRVKQLSEMRNLPYAVALDIEGAHVRAFGDVSLTPSSFLIDRERNIVSRVIGRFNLADWRARIAAM
ncbi:TlpA family protein disulfide reductase [Methylomonas sp. SURF-1]|uniref:TlpA family protein disulfide reductase n=1 Tax=Methylomonas aurea TaxID=2952224 RepID=A0ABT1ULM2_9GAMM|nr:TlpA disulfide reductase family protein [Methylomonas sp. SURF-1]MCQ8183103.1 TlpA family protein disulfide reductase [Methylomonas sp. SURF-1]